MPKDLISVKDFWFFKGSSKIFTISLIFAYLLVLLS